MKLIIWVLSTLCIASIAGAQTELQHRNPTPQESGWGVVYHDMTRNAGFYSIQCASSDTIWAAGSSIVRSTDHGISWQHIIGPAVAGPMAFVNGSTGYFTSWDKIIRTKNAGQTWDSVLTGAIALDAICFPCQDTGFAVGRQQICRTTNAGETWETLDLGSAPLESISFSDPKHGWAVGDQQFDQSHPKEPTAACFETSDGGAHWSVVFVGISRILYCVHALSPDTVLAGGDSGIIMTTNHGNSWSYVYYNPLDIYRDIQFESGGTGFAVTGYGKILSSSNKGASWFKQDGPTACYLWSVSFLKDSEWFIAGDSGYILRTTSGGKADVALPSIARDSMQVQVFPQPASTSITINYVLDKDATVVATIYDISGILIASLLNGVHQNVGPHSFEYSTMNLASGTYTYRIEVDGITSTGKFAVLH